jgi:cytochrome c553
MHPRLRILLLAFLTLLVLAAAEEAGPFEQNIRPILNVRCGECHGAKKTSGFSVASMESLLAGGNKYGRAVVEGHPEQSPLIKLVRGELTPRMPIGGSLSDAEISALESWIRTLKPQPGVTSPSPLWSLQRPAKQEPPAVQNAAWVRNPIDAFILSRIEQAKLAPAQPAPKRTLARRLYFDLIGLPPSPEEMKTFLDDNSGNSYEKLVDKLLADPRYGERWGRFWLDLVRFAESNGLEGDPALGDDTGLGNAWRYRDWVIDAFNSDMPYDRFLTLQIAGGDEQSKTGTKYKPAVRGYVPTGFLRVGPWSLYDNLVSLENRQTYLDEITGTTASAFLGLTLGCARCHDHKYDPIPSKDYYRFQAFFNTIQTQDIEVPFESPELQQKSELKIKEYTKRLKEGPERRELDAFEKELRQKFIEKKTAEAKKTELDVEDLRLEFRRKPQKIFTAEEQAQHAELLEDAQRVNDPEEVQALEDFEKPRLRRLAEAYADHVVDPLSRFEQLTMAEVRKELPSGDLSKYFSGAEQQRYHELADKIQVLERRLRRWRPVALTAINVPGPPTGPDIAPTRVLVRGDVYRPGEIVEPGFPSAITGKSEPATLEKDRFGQFLTRGRRITLAHWIANSDNPLTARVMVNRIWQNHFGRGIVGTPNNFGKNGDRPTHPQLLDWLALKFIQEKWSVKAVHRWIVTSSAYRQSADNPQFKDTKVDPENLLLWHFNRRRLEAEAIRDTLLFVSGRLSPERGGPSVFPALPEEVSDMAASVQFGGLMWEPNEKEEDGRRRSVYTFQRRSLPLPMLAAFDAPVFNESCERRNVTTTPLQALTMLNGNLANEEAAHLAARVVKEAGPSREAQIARVFEIVLNRPPTPGERQRFGNFDGPLDGVCRILLNSNELLFLE